MPCQTIAGHSAPRSIGCSDGLISKRVVAQMVIINAGDTAVTIQAAARQTGGVNAAMVYGINGDLA